MTSHDVRDMLDLAPSGSAPPPAKKLRVAAPRNVLKGLAREVQNLSGDSPIAIVPEVSRKKRRLARPAARWELKPFKNTAREEKGLVLRHWRMIKDKVPPPVEDDAVMEDVDAPAPEPTIEDSSFAKYNVQVNVPEYTDEEYNERLMSQDWTKDETDYLMKLVQEFDLRWPVIWDRYEYEPPVPQLADGEDAAANAGALVVPQKVRTMEDMKKRYYTVASNIMTLRKPPITMNSAEYNLMEAMKNFKPEQETARKKFAEAAFHRTKEEAAEEQSLLLELKRIMARSERLGEERKELYARLESPQGSGNMGVYTTSQGLAQLLQQLMSVDKSKKQRKSLMGGETMSPAQGPNGQNQQQAYDRRESSVRESISLPNGPNNKKGPQTPAERRQLTEEEEKAYGVTRFDRLTSGPAFRHEKIMKPLLGKSAAQQTKITNVLTELEIAPRLHMATEEVGVSFDSLIESVNVLLSQRKKLETVQTELEVAKATKKLREEAEKERPEGVNGGAEGEIKREGSIAARSIRGGSVQRKRSASVLSTVSESAKRQRK